MRLSRWLGALTLIAAVARAAEPAPAAAPDDACIAPIRYLPLDARRVGRGDDGVAALGTYERISPDGRFVLRSYSGAQLGRVSLMELPAGDGPVQAWRTPFSNEAFPVQGSWRFLVDVNGEHYRLADVLARQADARPLFRGGMVGFYAAASELAAPSTGPAAMPAATATATATVGSGAHVFIRSLSWPQNADPDAQGVGPLQMATLEVEDGPAPRVLRTLGPQFICGGRRAVDGTVYALPMLSVDGSEFSAIPQVPWRGQPSMRVYGLGADPEAEAPCTPLADLGESPAKAVFGFGPTWLTYSDLGNVYVFDRALHRAFRLDHGKHQVLASAFPGLTRDGRVIYGATWRDCADAASCPQQAGYVVIDPYQSGAWRDFWRGQGRAAPKACITQAEVAAERRRFAAFQGLR